MQVQKRMMESSTPKKRKLNVTIDLDEECFLTDEQTLSLYETSTVVSSEINSSKISFNIDDNEVIEDIEINLIPNHIHDTEKHEGKNLHSDILYVLLLFYRNKLLLALNLLLYSKT